jgi:transposase
MSLLGWLGHYGHLSYDKLAQFVETLCGWRPSVGTLDSMTTRLGEVLAPVVLQAKVWLKHQPVVYADETPWTVQGVKEWLWQFGTETVAIFHAAGSRSRAELVECLGEAFDGTLVSDDFSAYNGYRAKLQQRCLAPLRRHFKKLCLRPAEPEGISEAFMDLIDEVFTRYRQYQSDLDVAAIQAWGVAFLARLGEATAKWFQKASAEGRKLMNSLKARPEQWWQCLQNPSVRPDNNLSERNLRLGVTKRKVSGGSRSMEGFKRTAILLSVIQSCRRQSRSSIEFIRLALEASQAGGTLPTLIPASST